MEETDGPNQIGRENGRRRIVVYPNTDGGDMGRVIADIRALLDRQSLPGGTFVSLEGQFQAQEQATALIAGLSAVSLAMIFLVLYSRYQSAVLAGIVMANIPLALIGAVAAMWLAEANRLAPDSGTIKLGSKLEVAYSDQLRGHLDPEKNLIDNVCGGQEFIEINGKRRHAISYLGDFLFSPERVRTPVKALSGGEQNRAVLARLFSKPANLLVLDEPTNDLDIETLELLE